MSPTSKNKRGIVSIRQRIVTLEQEGALQHLPVHGDGIMCHGVLPALLRPRPREIPLTLRGRSGIRYWTSRRLVVSLPRPGPGPPARAWFSVGQPLDIWREMFQSSRLMISAAEQVFHDGPTTVPVSTLARSVRCLLRYPFPTICVHTVALELLSILEESNVHVPEEITAAITRCDNERALSIMKKEGWFHDGNETNG